jgi:hypothetical protein
MWVATISSSYSDLFVQVYDCAANPSGNCVNLAAESVHASTFITLAGIAALNLSALFGRKVAQRAGNSKFAEAARGFTTVAIIASLISAVFAALGVFIQHLNASQEAPSVIVSLIGTYLPIVLYAVLVLFVVLQAFVWKKGDHDDE